MSLQTVKKDATQQMVPLWYLTQDMKLWESLTYEQCKAVEMRDEEDGYASGIAKSRSMKDLIAEA